MSNVSLSDKGLSIFVFAAYHQLMSGELVTEVALHDHAGHAADREGIREIEASGLARVEGDRALFSDAGLGYLKLVLQAVRGTAGQAGSGRAIA